MRGRSFKRRTARQGSNDVDQLDFRVDRRTDEMFGLVLQQNRSEADIEANLETVASRSLASVIDGLAGLVSDSRVKSDDVAL